MDGIDLLVTMAAVTFLATALVLEGYKSLGRRRRTVEGFELIALNLMGWGLISMAGVLLGVVLMRGNGLG